MPSLTEMCQFTSFKQCIRSDTVKTPIWKKLITRWTFFLTLSWPESARSLQFTQNASALHWLAVWKLLWVFPRKTKQRQRWDPELLEEQTPGATSHPLSFLCSYSVLFALSTSLETKTQIFKHLNKVRHSLRYAAAVLSMLHTSDLMKHIVTWVNLLISVFFEEKLPKCFRQKL